MGNRFFRARRNTIEERYTRPQRLLRQPSNVDYKKLRKLILSHKLAPCFDGLEDSNSNSDLEECPICFFFYPSLNRSRCCSKGICTECFLQMNPSNAIRPAQCPFCKSSSYAVEFRGARTQEEKGLEQAEEQKVIEAKIRMQYQESQPTEQVTSTNQHLCPVEVQYPTEGAAVQHSNAGWTQDVANSNLPSLGRGIEASQFPFPNALNERHAEFGLNLDEVMLMEAIWQSIQHRTPPQFPESYGAVSGSQLETFGSSPGFPCFTAIAQQETPNCQASCSTTEVDSFHASQVSDDDMLKEEEEEEEMDVDNDTSSCSSVHTISDISNESPQHCCDIYGHQREYGPNASLGHQREYSGYQ